MKRGPSPPAPSAQPSQWTLGFSTQPQPLSIEGLGEFREEASRENATAGGLRYLLMEDGCRPAYLRESLEFRCHSVPLLAEEKRAIFGSWSIYQIQPVGLFLPPSGHYSEP